MQMGSRRTPGAGLNAEWLAAGDFVTFFDQERILFHVGINDFTAIFLSDSDIIAVTAAATTAAIRRTCRTLGIVITIIRSDNFAGSCCYDGAWPAAFGREVCSFMATVAV